MKKKVEKKQQAKTKTGKPVRPMKSAAPATRAQEKYRFLVENSQDGSFILQDANLILANKALASMTGYSIRKMIGMDFNSLLPPEESGFLEKPKKMRSSGDFDLHLLHRDGATKLFVRMSLRRIRYHQKPAFMGVVRNLAEVRKALEALERSERQYRELYDNLRDGFAVVNLKGKII
ncbi:MAG: PAS domain S-box protein, partial [Deltaproteobacteria bacterium]|nr:PAS domain S-box protein [Deltaproteobacteria bacterium]